MLSTPQDSMELQHKQSKPVAVTSFSFLANDVNNFVVGSEEGQNINIFIQGSQLNKTDFRWGFRTSNHHTHILVLPLVSLV